MSFCNFSFVQLSIDIQYIVYTIRAMGIILVVWIYDFQIDSK